MLDGLRLLEFCNDPGISAVCRDTIANQANILSGSDEGDCNRVDAVLESKLQILGAVSYTHLDVYKRQASLVGTTFRTLAENVEQGSRILLSDGLLELRVHDVDGDDVVCELSLIHI